MHRPDSPWFLRLIKVLGNGVCYLTALAATAVLIGRWLPFPEVPDIAPKFRYFAENQERFDTLFVGSSRFRHQVIPRLFDQQTAALGTPTRSLNIAYSGMWPPENFYFLRQLLALRPPHLKWVVFELIDGSTRFDENEAATLRMAYWHDWRHTRMAWGMLREFSGLTSGETRGMALLHARLFLRQSLHFGRGAAWVEKRFAKVKKKRQLSWMETRGFDPEPEPGTLIGPVLAAYQEKLETLKKPRPPSVLRPGLIDALRAVQAEVRAAGAETIFVLPPTVSLAENINGLPAGLPVLLFNDVHTDARLYEPDLHYDAGHLNTRGAEEFTRLLAERFAAWQRDR